MTALEGLGGSPGVPLPHQPLSHQPLSRERAADEALGRPVSARRPLARRVVMGLILGYQGARAGRLSPCRFYPSCSAYALEAVERHGVVRGLGLAARRLSRCRPLGGSGVDLVPLEVRSKRRR